MKIEDIVKKVNPDEQVLGIVLSQDLELILQTKLKVCKANYAPEEWQELISKCNAKIVEYLKNDQIFNAIRSEAGSFIIERTFRQCETLA